MELTQHLKDDRIVVSVNGEVNAVTAQELETALHAAADQADTVVIDATGLSYISSAGLRAVLTTAKLVKAKKGSLCMAGLQPSVLKVFEISGLDAIVSIIGSVDEACA